MAGALIAAGPVVVVAASFSNVAYERLPLEEGDDVPPPAPPRSDQPGVPFGGDLAAVAAGWASVLQSADRDAANADGWERRLAWHPRRRCREAALLLTDPIRPAVSASARAQGLHGYVQ